jgi:hypothetical protein
MAYLYREHVLKSLSFDVVRVAACRQLLVIVVASPAHATKQNPETASEIIFFFSFEIIRFSFFYSSSFVAIEGHV